MSCAFSSERRSVDGISSWIAWPFFFALGTAASWVRAGMVGTSDPRDDDAARPTLSGPPAEFSGHLCALS
ncbi:hypothetical protein GCM10009859_17450 [Kocuria salsicia]